MQSSRAQSRCRKDHVPRNSGNTLPNQLLQILCSQRSFWERKKYRWKHTIFSRQDQQLKKERKKERKLKKNYGNFSFHMRIAVSPCICFLGWSAKLLWAAPRKEQSEMQRKVNAQVCSRFSYVVPRPFSTLSWKFWNTSSWVFSFYAHFSFFPQDSAISKDFHLLSNLSLLLWFSLCW